MRDEKLLEIHLPLRYYGFPEKFITMMSNGLKAHA
jgi:hypothetical protein